MVVSSVFEMGVRDCRISWSRGVKIGSWNVIGEEEGRIGSFGKGVGVSFCLREGGERGGISCMYLCRSVNI